MTRKKLQEELLKEYVSAHDATQILSTVNKRIIRTDYVQKLRKSKKHQVRTVKYGRFYLYNRDDLQNCIITHVSGQHQLQRKGA